MSVNERKIATKRPKKVPDSQPSVVSAPEPPVVVSTPVVEAPKLVEPPIAPPKETAVSELDTEVENETESTLTKKVQKPKKLISHAEKQIITLLKQLETLKSTDREMTKNKQIKLQHNIELSVHNLKNIVDALKQCIVEKPSRNTSSGFMKRVRISEQLRTFGMTHGGWLQTDFEMSRVDATKAICSHIQKMELGDPSDKRRIKMSPELKSLFSDVDGDWISYPEIQKQIQQHFMTTPVATA
jgi:chromatin remodeling complex protein RSC6